jgi:hypothetical protein
VLSWIGSIVTLGALPGLAKLLAPKSEFAESLKRYLLGDQADTKKLGEFENLFGNFSTLHDSVSEESELARDLETARSTLDKKRAEQKAVEGNIRSLRNVLGPAREAMTEILTDRLYWNGSDPTGYNLTFFNELCGICRDVFGEQSIDGAGGICDIFDRVSRQLQELAQNPAAVNGSRLKQVQRTVFRLKEQCESLKSQMIDRAKTMTEDSSFEEMAARDETHLREMLAKRESESTPSGLDVIAAKVRETAAEAGEAVARAGEAVAEFGTKAKAAVLGFLRKSSSSSEGGETAPAQTSESPKTVKKKLDDTEIKKMQNREKSNKAEIEARKERQESFETKMKNMVTGIGEDLKYLQSINMSTGSEGTASIEQLEERVNSLQSSLEAKRGKITGLSASILESIQQLESQE